MNELTHKGYTGSIEHDLEEGVLHGSVLGTRDVITYEAKTLSGLAKAFRGSVDVYLRHCEETGKVPDREYSGRVLARMDPALHRRLATTAEARGVRLNDLLVRSIERGLMQD